MTAIFDELGHRTQFEYDALNRLVKITEADPDGAGPLNSPTTTFAYDAQGNLVATTDALQNQQSFQYDALHRVTQATDQRGQSVVYQYDDSGNVISVTDRLERQTQFVYDDRNRVVERINAIGGRARWFLRCGQQRYTGGR